MKNPPPLPQSVRVLRYELDGRDCYQKGTSQPSISKISQTETENQNSQQPDERYPSVDSHCMPLAPQNSDSKLFQYVRGIRERDPQTQVMANNMSDRVQNQSSRQVLMASIRARRSFIESTDLSSDMNTDSAVVIKMP